MLFFHGYQPCIGVHVLQWIGDPHVQTLLTHSEWLSGNLFGSDIVFGMGRPRPISFKLNSN